MKAPIDIIGAGAFGTALAIVYGRAGHEVTLCARAHADEMQMTRQNTRRLPDVELPDSVRVTGEVSELRSPTAVVALPTQTIGDFLQFNPLQAAHLVSTAKGIDRATGLGPTGLIARHTSAVPAQLTGPSFAVDLAADLPTALTLACADDGLGAELQALLSNTTTRLYRTTDIIGAELGGALKNVVAIAAGVAIGAGLGDSARAAVIARGFAEMTRVAMDAGAQAATLTGLSGLGDLVLTCTSPKSRNFRFGMSLAKGEPVDATMTVEGVHTAHQIAQRKNLDTPLCDAVSALANGNIGFSEVLDTLLNRPLKPE